MDDSVDTPLGISLSQKIFAYHLNRRGNEGLGSYRHDGIHGLDLERRYGLGACSSGELGEDGTHGLAPWRTRGLEVAVFQDTLVAGRFVRAGRWWGYPLYLRRRRDDGGGRGGHFRHSS